MTTPKDDATINHVLNCQDEDCSLQLDEQAIAAEPYVLHDLLVGLRRSEDLPKLRRHLSVQQFMRLGLSVVPPKDKDLTREQMCFVGNEALHWAPTGAVLSFVDLLTIQLPADGRLPADLWIRQHTAAIGKDADWVKEFCGKPMVDFLRINGTTLVTDGHLKRTRERSLPGTRTAAEVKPVECCEREYLVPSTPPETRSPYAWEDFLENQGVTRNAHSHIAVGISLPVRPELRFQRVVGHVWLEFDRHESSAGEVEISGGRERLLLPIDFVAAFEYALGALCMTYLAEVASKALDRTSRLQRTGQTRELRLRKSSVKVERQYKDLEAAMRELRQEIAGTPAATVQTWLDQTVQAFFDTAPQTVKVLRFSFASNHSLWTRERAAAMLCALAAVPDDGVAESAEAAWRRWLTTLSAADFEHSELLRCLRRARVLDDRFLTWVAAKEEHSFFELTGKAGREKDMTPFRFLLSTGAHLLEEEPSGNLRRLDTNDYLSWPHVSEQGKGNEALLPGEILLDAVRRMAEANLAYSGQESLDPVGFTGCFKENGLKIVLIPFWSLETQPDGSSSWKLKEPRKSQDVDKLWTKYKMVKGDERLEGSDTTRALLELRKACEGLNADGGVSAELKREGSTIYLTVMSERASAEVPSSALAGRPADGEPELSKGSREISSASKVGAPPWVRSVSTLPATTGVRIVSFRLDRKQTWAAAVAEVGLKHDPFDGDLAGGQAALLKLIAEIEARQVAQPLLFLFHGWQHPPAVQIKRICAAGRAVALFGTADRIPAEKGKNWWLVPVDDDVEVLETLQHWNEFFRKLASANSLEDCHAACETIYDVIGGRPR